MLETNLFSRSTLARHGVVDQPPLVRGGVFTLRKREQSASLSNCKILGANLFSSARKFQHLNLGYMTM